jgi:gluconokinase
MAAGIPLTDADRAPWLAALRTQIEHWLAAGQTAVLACSALKHAYQQQLTAEDPRIRLIYLQGTPDLIAARLEHRHGHYAKADLLASQFAALEPPVNALTLSIADPPETLVTQILTTL